MKSLTLGAAALLLLITSAVGQNAPAAKSSAASEMPAAAAGQTMSASPGTPAADQSTPVKNPVATALRDLLPTRRKNTVEALEAMPEDKYNYKPSPAQNTFAHLAAHMSDANYALCSGAAAVPPPKFEKVSEWTPKDKLITALNASFDFCADALAKMDDARLGEMEEGGPGGQKVSRARFALGIASNWADHYAEAAMYLRLNGILPPTAHK